MIQLDSSHDGALTNEADNAARIRSIKFNTVQSKSRAQKRGDRRNLNATEGTIGGVPRQAPSLAADTSYSVDGDGCICTSNYKKVAVGRYFS